MVARRAQGRHGARTRRAARRNHQAGAGSSPGPPRSLVLGCRRRQLVAQGGAREAVNVNAGVGAAGSRGGRPSGRQACRGGRAGRWGGRRTGHRVAGAVQRCAGAVPKQTGKHLNTTISCKYCAHLPAGPPPPPPSAASPHSAALPWRGGRGRRRRSAAGGEAGEAGGAGLRVPGQLGRGQLESGRRFAAGRARWARCWLPAAAVCREGLPP